MRHIGTTRAAIGHHNHQRDSLRQGTGCSEATDLLVEETCETAECDNPSDEDDNANLEYR